MLTDRHRLALQYTLIFVIFPALISLSKPRGWIYAVLWLMAAWTLALMKRKFNYSFKADWHAEGLTREVAERIFLRFIPFAAALFAFAWYMAPEFLFSLPRERPITWIVVLIWYPALSVIPQEVIFRSFFFRQYAHWFEKWHWGALANAFAFGWLHIILQNWVAIVFSAIGSYLFADTYRKTKSLAAVSFEHALYGCYIFTIGLGRFFYHGHAVQ